MIMVSKVANLQLFEGVEVRRGVHALVGVMDIPS